MFLAHNFHTQSYFEKFKIFCLQNNMKPYKFLHIKWYYLEVASLGW
jgi:hypothetical protein